MHWTIHTFRGRTGKLVLDLRHGENVESLVEFGLAELVADQSAVDDRLTDRLLLRIQIRLDKLVIESNILIFLYLLRY